MVGPAAAVLDDCKKVSTISGLSCVCRVQLIRNPFVSRNKKKTMKRSGGLQQRDFRHWF